MKFTLVPTTNNPNPNMETTLHFEKATTAVGTAVAKGFNRNHECVGVLAIDTKLCVDGTVPMTQEILDKLPDAWDAPIYAYHDVQLGDVTRIYVTEFDIPNVNTRSAITISMGSVTTTPSEWMVSHNGQSPMCLADMKIKDLKALHATIGAMIPNKIPYPIIEELSLNNLKDLATAIQTMCG